MASYDDTATVSGSVVSFSDGADDVPTKSLVVTIPPTLSGVSAVTETQTERNVRQNVTDYSSVNPVFFQYRNYYAGQATGYPKLEGTFKAGTYTLSFDTNASITASKVGVWAKKKSDQNWYNLSANGDLVSPTSSGYSFCSVSSGHVTGTFTINEECDALGFGYYQYGTSIPYTNLMLEIGSTAHAYEPYQTPTQYTASLGRTIYGGTADIVNGVGSDENKKFTVTSDMSDSIRYVGSGDTAYIQINKTPASNGRWQDLVCSHFTPANIYAGGTQQGIGCYSSQFYIRDSQFASKQDFLDFLDEQETLGTPLEICYKLATPTDFTFTGKEVPTRLGYNAFWSEQGDSEVTYYKDGYGFTSVTVHKETPEGEPVVKTAKLHKVIYGGTADVIRGTCEPKNLLPMTNYDGGVYNPDVGRQLNLTVSQTQFEKTGGVYSISTTSTWKTFTVLFPIISGATYHEKWTLSVESGQQGSTRAYLDEDFKVLAKYNNNSSDPITTNMIMTPPTGAKYLAITWTNRGTAVQTLNITEPQIENGTSASDFTPNFEPFSFPPISMSTDEGENTLFANEGDSAITYRKAVD